MNISRDMSMWRDWVLEAGGQKPYQRKDILWSLKAAGSVWCVFIVTAWVTVCVYAEEQHRLPWPFEAVTKLLRSEDIGCQMRSGACLDSLSHKCTLWIKGKVFKINQQHRNSLKNPDKERWECKLCMFASDSFRWIADFLCFSFT